MLVILAVCVCVISRSLVTRSQFLFREEQRCDEVVTALPAYWTDSIILPTSVAFMVESGGVQGISPQY